jgi:dTDP-4-amino-4,6-dideoxygalactose transaminase
MSHAFSAENHPVPFIDLRAQRQRLADPISASISRVLQHGEFVLGPEVGTLEKALGQFCGAEEVITCANGTDALALVLMAKELASGQAVFCPSFTFAATAEVIAWFGAIAIFVDVDPRTFNIDVSSLEAGMEVAKRKGLHAVGVITVDLFGQPCDYESIEPFCEKHGMWLLADAAQSFGACYKGRNVGTIGAATTTSFFPAKPLGCYGDGGAIFTNERGLAELLRSLRVHGQGIDKYDNVRIGMNSRLDTLQAAILIEKLSIFADEVGRRNAIAFRYSEALSDLAVTPTVLEGCVSVWAQYTIKVDAEKRDTLAGALKSQGIPTAIYYAKPLHMQSAYRHFPVAGNGLPISEKIAQQVISLPMHAYLEPEVQDRIVQMVRSALR